MSSTKKAVLSLSGGMDSSTLLIHLLANGYEVTALGFDYGQKHRVELERASSLVEYINSNSARTFGRDTNSEEYDELYPKVNHQFDLIEKIHLIMFAHIT